MFARNELKKSGHEVSVKFDPRDVSKAVGRSREVMVVVGGCIYGTVDQ